MPESKHTDLEYDTLQAQFQAEVETTRAMRQQLEAEQGKVDAANREILALRTQLRATA